LYSPYFSPKISRSASSSGMICKKLIRKMNTIFIIIPNQVPNQIVEAIVNNSNPRYIGFLEYRYIPSVTSAVASEGFKGEIVVLSLANNLKEGNAHAKPRIRTKILNEP
jgi:hypothetical protein